MDHFFSYPLISDWTRPQEWQPEPDFQKPPIAAKEQKDIPEWLRVHHQWETAVDVNKLPKHQLKVKMCCSKCAEKVVEEIREVYGVFDVRAEKFFKKVIVVATPGGFDEREVLRRARKIHWKAKYVELDANEKPKKDDKNKNKQQEGDNKNMNKGGNEQGNTGNKNKGGNKELQAASSQSKSNIGQVQWGQLAYPPIGISWPNYYYSPNQVLLYPTPHGQYVKFV